MSDHSARLLRARERMARQYTNSFEAPPGTELAAWQLETSYDFKAGWDSAIEVGAALGEIRFVNGLIVGCEKKPDDWLAMELKRLCEESLVELEAALAKLLGEEKDG